MSTHQKQSHPAHSHPLPSSSAPKNLLWVTDPWDTLDHPKDTTLRLIQEGARMGLKQSWCDVKSIRLENGKILLNSYSIIQVLEERRAGDFQFGELEILSPSRWSHIHYRTDPPVDQDYLYPLQLIALDLNSSSSQTQVINPISILFSHNEKLEAFSIPEYMPETFVGCSWEQLHEFGVRLGKTVLKPLNEAQSKGIELLDWSNSSSIEKARSKIEILSHGFKTPVLLQKYIDEIQHGETRLWYVDGDLIGVIKKLPLLHDFRVNLDRGSKLSKTSLTQEQIHVSHRIGADLKSKRIRLAAVDLIGCWITDFNFTSPGLIPQMEQILGQNLASVILEKTLITDDSITR